MTDSELTVAILRELREGFRSTRDELRAFRADVNARFDNVTTRFEVVEHSLKDLAGQQLMLTRFVKNVAERHGASIEDLDERVTRLEKDQ